MHWSRRSALVLALLLSVTPAFAKPPGFEELCAQVSHGEDFRVRVSAALQLGKSLSPEALAPLEAALDDNNASVRAAAAAALKNLGETSAIEVLKAHRADKSEAVKSQVVSAIKSLEDAVTTPPKAKVLIQFGIMKNGSGVKSSKAELELANSSRRKLGALPGVRVLAEDNVTSPGDVPVVMVTGNIQELKASREGTNVVYSASVEFVLHTMPEQSIAAKVSGRASATASEQEANDKAKSAELRRSVLEAAIASALRRAPPALLAAARL